jgi:uncharacterized protein YuzB (UPF0349 family)
LTKVLKIRFCRHNAGALSASRQLTMEFPGLDIKCKDCLKQCKSCRSILFATVNKQKFTANSEQLLLDELRRMIANLIN